jgi:hypothetical protein
MARRIDRRAGYTMLRQMRERGIQTPVVFYAGGGSADHDAESRERGALGSGYDGDTGWVRSGSTGRLFRTSHRNRDQRA